GEIRSGDGAAPRPNRGAEAIFAGRARLMAVTWTDTPNSSNVKRVGFDDETQDVQVEFASGGIYVVPGAGPTVAADMAASQSPGQYYNRNIRNQYPVRKLS